MNRQIEETLAGFNLPANVTDCVPGPVVTTYRVKPRRGTRIKRLRELTEDLALTLGVASVRVVVSPQGELGLEVPSAQRQIVPFNFPRTSYQNFLPLHLGVTTTGKYKTFNLIDAPHLLVAGSTGSGKSVLIHSIVKGLIDSVPEHAIKLVYVDPKRLEFQRYRGRPTTSALVTEGVDAVDACEQLVMLMEQRYQLLAAASVSSISEYWASGRANMPYVVLVIDEWADLFLSEKKKIETPVIRLAQKARAAGIHIVLATQRPTAKVISGLVKANFPARVALRVASKVDSRVIIDQSGAETLLGKGDMLVTGFGLHQPLRLHGAYLK